VSRFDEVLAGFQACLNTLPDKPEENARATLAALWQLAQGQAVSVSTAKVEACGPLNQSQEDTLQQLMARRLAGEPLAYITGRQQFMGLQMLAEPGALIPRRETQILARAAVELAAKAAEGAHAALVLDVCTGIGNVALAIAHHVPPSQVFVLTPWSPRTATRRCCSCTIEWSFASGICCRPLNWGSLRAVSTC
jgi:release factor glutamine methyltransferase